MQNISNNLPKISFLLLRYPTVLQPHKNQRMTQMIGWPYEILFIVSLIDIFVTFSNMQTTFAMCHFYLCAILKLNEVKWSLTELTTRSDCVCVRYIGVVVGRRSIVCEVFSGFSPPFLPLLFLTVYQYDGCLSFQGHWGGGGGLMAGLSGFASHQSSLHLGAGCQ